MFEEQESSETNFARLGLRHVETSADCIDDRSFQPNASSQSETSKLEELVEKFEIQWFKGRDSLNDFLTQNGTVSNSELIELIRCEMEFLWQVGQSVTLADYEAQFPQLVNDNAGRLQVAFEEYRQRHCCGQPLPVTHWREVYGLETGDWPPLSTQKQNDSVSTNGQSRISKDLQPGVLESRRLLPGERFAGFSIVGALGEGAFGTVYLATQGELAHRFVVLKITPCDSREPQILAEMQHSNVMPILSLHKQENCLAICMPFLGMTTLRDIQKYAREHNVSTVFEQACLDTVISQKNLQVENMLPASSSLKKLRFDTARKNRLVEAGKNGNTAAVLWLVLKIADGLAYAHDHGIVHGDLKPANILIDNEGNPLLLDFHLSQWLQQEGFVPEGGTLPYMAPEHLRGMYSKETVDHRSDIFSLGVIMYELLTDHSPFAIPKTSDREMVRGLAADRAVMPKKPSEYSPKLSTDLDEIILKCLAYELEDRYQTCQELIEDIQRYQCDLPIKFANPGSRSLQVRKWWKRNGKVATWSSLVVSGSFVCLLLAVFLVNRSQQLGELQNAVEWNKRQDVMAKLIIPLSIVGSADLQQELAVQQALDYLEQTQATNLAEWETRWSNHLSDSQQSQERQRISQVYFWLAQAYSNSTDLNAKCREIAKTWNELAGRFAVSPTTAKAIKLQSSYLSDPSHPRANFDEVTLNSIDAASEAIMFASVAMNSIGGEVQPEAALKVAEQQLDLAISIEPSNYSAWLLHGNLQAKLGNLEQAVSSFSVCIAMDQKNPKAFYHRGLANYERHRFVEAINDYQKTVELLIDNDRVYFALALAQKANGDLEGALVSIDKAIHLCNKTKSQYHFNRAKILHGLAALAESRQELEKTVLLDAVTELDCIARALAFYQLDDFANAIAVFQQTLERYPRSSESMQNLAHLFAEQQNDNAKAIELMDQVVAVSAIHPFQLAEALATRGVLKAREGKLDEAVADGRLAIATYETPEVKYQVAGIYSLASFHVMLGRQFNGSDENSDPDQLVKQAVDLLKQASADRPKMVARKLDVDPDLSAISTSADFMKFRAALLLLTSADDENSLEAKPKGDIVQ